MKISSIIRKSFLTCLLVSVSLALPLYAADAPRRGLYISVIQDPPVLSGRESILGLARYAEEKGIKDLFVQVYRANKSWFASGIADCSPYRECLKSVGEDPLALLIRACHEKGIKVHGWLNILSLGSNSAAPLLKKYGASVLTRNRAKKRRLSDYKIDDQYFLEPGDPRVREELVRLIGEFLSAYPSLDGIQFDYVRYPDKHPAYGYTRTNMERYKASAGKEIIEEGSRSWNDWKRRQVSEVMETLARKARALAPRMQVSATGCAPYVRAFHEAFQDWPSWLSAGLVDFVTVMSYTTDNAEFEKDIAEAREHAGNALAKVAIAVGAYEMIDSPGVFSRQLGTCEQQDCRGCVIFHYGSLLREPLLGRALDAE